MRYISPLRYPGGKARLGPLLDTVIRQTELTGCRYVEPYAGGAGAALHLLHRETVSSIEINDASEAVYAFWKAVTEETTGFCDRIADAMLSVEEWKRQRALLRNPEDSTTLDVGFAAFYLNRTNRSGIIMSGGLIGGLRQEGTWRLDARFNRDGLIERVRWIGERSEQIKVSKLDALDLLVKLEEEDNVVLYLDPPYYHQAERLYERWYDPDDHAAVSKAVKRLRHPWIVSYDDCTEVRTLYAGIPARKLSLAYTAARRYEGAEVIFFCSALAKAGLTSA